MKPWAMLWCAAALLLGGCATPPPAQRAPMSELFHDQLFKAPAAPIDTATIFALNDRMRDYLKHDLPRRPGEQDARRALFDALYRRDQLKLEYDSAMTRNAAQTFEARAGNCLSLVIMTAALARELNFTVQYETARLLEEHTIVAMYLNNRAAELLSAGSIDDAYWAARQSVEADPSFLNGYNTLAVIYQNHGDVAQAEQALRHALRQAPNNTIFLSNLAQTLETQQRPAEAAAVRARLAQLEPYPPFYFFHLGLEAVKLGDYVRARHMFERELERAPDYHEFHYWLAVSQYQLGNLREADKHMRQALENSTTRGHHDLYAAKLDRIRAYEAKVLK